MVRKVLYIISFLNILIGLNAQDISIVSVISTPVSCGGESDGSITIEVSGGNGELSYMLYSIPPALPIEIVNSNSRAITFDDGHPKGSYLILILDGDDNTTDASAVASIGGPSPINISNVTATDASCATYSDGTITVTASGEQGNLIYTLDGTVSRTQNNGNFNSLPAGTYNVTVSDADGCPSSDSETGIVIIEPVAMSAAVDNIIDASCFGGNNGSAEITITNGALPHTFVWSSGLGFSSTDEDPSGMRADVYSVEVTDNNGCILNFPNLVTIDEPDDISVLVNNVSDVSCFGGADGSVDITTSNGTPNYTYIWTGDNTGHTSTEQNPNNLPADTYDLEVTDANLCVKTFNNLITIGEPSEISMTPAITHVACNGAATGQINITVTGGTGTYTYSWSGPNSYTSASKDLTGIGAGTYEVVIKDVNNCSKTFPNIIVNENLPIEATFLVTDLSCFEYGDGEIDATVTGGIGPYNYSWTGNNGYTNTSDEDISNLDAAAYILSVTDNAGCNVSFPAQPVNEPDAITVTVNNINDALCFGSSDGSAAITPANGVAPYSYNWTGSLGYSSTDEDPINMPADVYTVTITEGGGCSRTFTDLVTIGEPTELNTILDSKQDVNCFGGSDGSTNITVSGGTMPYSALWTGQNTGHSSTAINATGLPPDTYNLQITDANSCTKTYNNFVTINEPAELTLSSSITDVSCNSASTGEIDITVSGGTAPYTYDWTGPNSYTSTDEDLTGLAAGTYEVVVRDINTCIKTFSNIVVNENPPIITTFNVTDINCFGYDNGSIEPTTTGGVPPYSYNWVGPGTYTSTDEDISSLAPGNYTLTVTDIFGCTKEQITQTVIEPGPMTITVDNTTETSCFGGSDGTAAITIGNGSTPFSFLWSGTLGYTSTDEDPSGMPADTYSVTVTEGGGCMLNFNDVLTITQPNAITAVLDGSSDALCNGSSNGTASVTVSDGTPGYSYVWTGNVTSHSSSIEDPINLIADTYDLEVTDANSCVQTFNNFAIIGEPSLISVTPTISHVSCNGEETGAIDIEVSGGTSGYTFVWTSPSGFNSTNEDISNIGSGSYSVEVKDANGCTQSFGPFDVLENSAMTATFTPTNLKCNGSGDGAIDTELSGGAAPYTYNWTSDLGYTNTVDEDLINLNAASYTLEVTDNNGCEQSFPAVLITEPEVLLGTFSSTDITCYAADNGSVDLTISGGTGPFTIAWSGPNGFTSPNEDIAGLKPGDYSVIITDINSCSVNYINQVVIDEPTEINAVSSHSNISCFGYDDGSISILSSGGTPDYTYTWSGPDSYNSNDQNISSLAPGSYDLEIRDANSCIKTFPGIETIDEPSGITLNITNQTDLSCFGDTDGNIEINVSGGTAPLSFSWTNNSGTEVSTDEDPTLLAAGVYSLTVTDNNSCSQEFSDTVTLIQPDKLLTVLSKSDIACNGETNGSISAATTGGTAPYEYSFFSGGPYGSNNTFTGLSSGTYNIHTKDLNGCSTSNTVEIVEPEIINYEYSISGQNLCHGDSLATININNVTGGVTPYVFSIDGGLNFQSESVFNKLPGGSYPVVVQDANLCEQAIAPLTILEPAEIKITFHDVDHVITCYDSPEGRIAIQASGGTGSLEYSLDGAAGVSVGEFLNLTKGDYLVSIIDDNTCSKDTTFEVLGPPEIIFDHAIVNIVTGCPGDSNGELDVQASGGGGGVEYSLDGAPYVASGVFTGLIAGDYLITVRDVNGCTRDTTLTITEPASMQVESESATPAICNASSTGSVTIEISGGTSPYTYTLNPGVLPPQTDNNTFTGLPAGDYQISVNDFQGCGPISSNIITITEPPELIIDSVIIEDITCNSSANGSISIYISGGVKPYEFSIDNEVTYGSDSIFNNLDVATYNVFVKDAYGCKLNVANHNMTEPTAISISTVKTDVSPCAGDANGTITASATGGWGIFEYSIDGSEYQSSGMFSDLDAGLHSLTARDTEFCTSTVEVTIDEPVPVNATVSHTNYTDDALGTITISDPTGGTAPYEYSISGSTGTFSTTTYYSDLLAGTYEVVVRDANLCEFYASINILEIIPILMDLDTQHVSCFGFDDGSIEFLPVDAVGDVFYSIDGGANYVGTALFENLKGDSVYYLKVYDSEGKQYTDSVYIQEPDELFIFKNVTAAECNAFSETGTIDLDIIGGTGTHTTNWSDGSTEVDRNSIVAGWHVVEVEDEKGCTVSDSIFVPSLAYAFADAGNDTTICAGSSILLQGVQGNLMNWEPATYLTKQNIAQPVAINVKDSISYIYTVTENSSGYNCYNKDTVHIHVLPMYGISATEDTIGFKEQYIQLSAESDGNIITWEWSPEQGLDQTNIADPTVILQSDIAYIVSGTNDYGCVETDTVIIEVIEDLKVYNAFSPNNGDAVNDYFDIEDAYRFPQMVVEVYNRWGSKVFSTVGYTDDKRWDGTINGKDAPMGTYYYIIVPYPDAKAIKGSVTIIR